MASCIAAFSSVSVGIRIAIVCSACMRNLSGVSKILSTCYPLFIVWPLGQSISFVNFARFWDNFVVKSGQEEGPIGLAMCERLFGSKVPEIGVIREDLSQVEISLKVMAKVTKHVDDSQ